MAAILAAAQLHNAAGLLPQPLPNPYIRNHNPTVAPADVTATVEPQLAAAVWGLPYTPTRIHMVQGVPASIAEVIPLQLEDLRPANLTKPAMLGFLQLSLRTRAAVKQGVQCMVLSSASYLPSQLDTISSLADGISIRTTCCISTTSIHILLMPSALAGLFGGDQHQRFADITRTSCELLTPTLEEVQLLPAERLAAATAAERTLNRHLRLWHPPTWGETLQQVLQSRHGMQRVMAGEHFGHKAKQSLKPAAQSTLSAAAFKSQHHLDPVFAAVQHVVLADSLLLQQHCTKSVKQVLSCSSNGSW